MHETNINALDLNLLKALHGLLETASVTRAAERVNLSQPAMSRALERLRHTLQDPLLVRSGRGMMLTPRAESLIAPVQTAVAQLGSVFAPQIFDPSKANDLFRIMAPDYLAQKIMPSVLSRVFNAAPNIQIEIENLSGSAIRDLNAGKISLGFGVVDDGPALENVAAQGLMTDKQVCLMRRGHPLAADDLKLTGFAQARHALLSITGKGGGRIDDVLKTHGLSRSIALRVAHFLTVSSVIETTDLIITVPGLLANQILNDKLVKKALPPELQIPSFTVSQIWHQRFSADPAHQWLRRVIKSVCAEDSSITPSKQHRPRQRPAPVNA